MTPTKFLFGGAFVVKALLVGLGGFLGSVSRYLLGGFVQQLSQSVDFPYGTLTVNLLGCFVIGFLSQLAEARGVFTPETRLLVFIGILGGFTTFSSFGNETLNLFRDGQTWLALGNIGANVILGLILVWLGRTVAYSFWR
jgi:fluoride exporter